MAADKKTDLSPALSLKQYLKVQIENILCVEAKVADIVFAFENQVLIKAFKKRGDLIKY